MKNENLIKKVRVLNTRMLKLADEGETAARDDNCLVLYSIMKDSAYRIKKQFNDKMMNKEGDKNGE
jgi:hypothetical protein